MNINKVFILISTALLCSAKYKKELRIERFNNEQALNIAKKYLPDKPVILDAGAYTGSEISLMKKIWPGSVVHAFEPVPEIFKKLNDNVKKYSNIYTYKLGIDVTGGPKNFYLSNQPRSPEIVSESSSLREPKEHLKHSKVQFRNQIEIECVNLDDWAKQNNIKSIDMLWLDMQGVELEVMKSAPKIMENVKVVCTEVEFIEAYAGQALWADVRGWMESQGFSLVARAFDLPPSVWFGDAIFARK